MQAICFNSRALQLQDMNRTATAFFNSAPYGFFFFFFFLLSSIRETSEEKLQLKSSMPVSDLVASVAAAAQ